MLYDGLLKNQTLYGHYKGWMALLNFSLLSLKEKVQQSLMLPNVYVTLLDDVVKNQTLFC